MALQPESLPILVSLPERTRQRRWTVLLRAILALPVAVAVFVVGIAAGACTVIGWFAALVNGRAPRFVRSAVTVLLHLTTRLEAYVFFLTDRFPPFNRGDVPAYPIGIAVPPATRLNRAAVLFRLVLTVPANIALRFVGLGLYVLAFFMWVVVLITGWLPRPFHDAYGAFLRYEVRLLGYLALLVPTYPSRLFGDDRRETWAFPGVEVSQRDTSDSDANLSARPSLPQRDWNLMLGRGAKRVLVLAIVLGIATAISLQALNLRAQNHEDLVQVNNQLVSSLNTFAGSVSTCEGVACPGARGRRVLPQQARFLREFHREFGPRRRESGRGRTGDDGGEEGAAGDRRVGQRRCHPRRLPGCGSSRACDAVLAHAHHRPDPVRDRTERFVICAVESRDPLIRLFRLGSDGIASGLRRSGRPVLARSNPWVRGYGDLTRVSTRCQ